MYYCFRVISELFIGLKSFLTTSSFCRKLVVELKEFSGLTPCLGLTTADNYLILFSDHCQAIGAPAPGFQKNISKPQFNKTAIFPGRATVFSSQVASFILFFIDRSSKNKSAKFKPLPNLFRALSGYFGFYFANMWYA
jgi:hypothetical protein